MMWACWCWYTKTYKDRPGAVLGIECWRRSICWILRVRGLFPAESRSPDLGRIKTWPSWGNSAAINSIASQYPHTSACSYSADSNLRRTRTECIYFKNFLCEIVTRSRKYGRFRPGLTCSNTVLQCAVQAVNIEKRNSGRQRTENKIRWNKTILNLY